MADQTPSSSPPPEHADAKGAATKKGRGTEKKKRRLGRGLGSLIPVPVDSSESVAPASPPPSAPVASADLPDRPLSSPGLEVPHIAGVAPPSTGDQPDSAPPSGVRRLPLSSIVPNTYQPREEFAEASLDELAASIKQSGLVQPIVVRSTGNPDSWELVAGERRFRAMKQLGRSEVPAIVVEADDQEAAELALIENVHREDLNPVERARGLMRLREVFGLTQKALAERVGLDRSSIANLLRILELDDFSMAAVRRGSLSLGHAKALLSISDTAVRRATAAAAVNGAWSVRELERRVRALLQSSSTEPGEVKGPITTRQANVVDLERRLTEALGLRVQITLGRKKGTGKIQIGFETLEEFDHLTERLGLPRD